MSKRHLDAETTQNKRQKVGTPNQKAKSNQSGVLGKNDNAFTESVKADLIKTMKKEDKKQKNQAVSALKVAIKQKNIQEFNKLIKDLGNAGKSRFALLAYQNLLTAGLTPNDYTFANLLNSCVRVGEVDLARKYFLEMGKYNLKPNEVTFTIIIKGYSQEGRTKEAYNVFDEMEKAGVKPNIRTYNTILRGCFRAGDVESAKATWKHMESNNVAPDHTTLDNMTRLYAQSLDLIEALNFLARIEAIVDGTDATLSYYANAAQASLAGAALAVANACAVLNDCKSATRMVEKARRVITSFAESEKKRPLQGAPVDQLPPSAEKENDDEVKHFPRNRSQKDIEKKRKQAIQEAKAKRESNTRSKITVDYEENVNLFLVLRTRELENECLRIERWLTSVAERQKIAVDKVLKDEKLSKQSWRPQGQLANGLGTTHSVFVSFPTTSTISGAAIDGAIRTFNKNKNKLKGEDIPANATGIEGRLLDWSRIFRNDNPICVEICSGNGEWICERARLNPNINWIAIEMRYERVVSIWNRTLLSYLPNVAVIFGEAKHALQTCFADESVQEFFVNYPDPPSEVSSKFRLIDTELLRRIHTLLTNKKVTVENKGNIKHKKNTPEEEKTEEVLTSGTLTMLTDDSAYAAMTLKELVERNKGLYNSTSDDGALVQYEVPSGYGTSFYHRFWDVGHKALRFYFHLTKNVDYVDVATVTEEASDDDEN